VEIIALPPQAILAIGSVLIHFEERLGYLSNTADIIDAIVKETPNTAAFNKAFEGGVHHVSQYPGYYLTTLTVKGSGDAIIAMHLGNQLLSLLSLLPEFFDAIRKNPTIAMNIYSRLLAKINPCQDVIQLSGSMTCAGGIISIMGVLKNIKDEFYREKITYSMEILGIMKFIEEQIIPSLQTAMNQWNNFQYESLLQEAMSSIHQGTIKALPLITKATATATVASIILASSSPSLAIAFPWLLPVNIAFSAINSITEVKPVTHQKGNNYYLDSCHSSWNCYILFM
jgi:hypothetical protein